MGMLQHDLGTNLQQMGGAAATAGISSLHHMADEEETSGGAAVLKLIINRQIAKICQNTMDYHGLLRNFHGNS